MAGDEIDALLRLALFPLVDVGAPHQPESHCTDSSVVALEKGANIEANREGNRDGADNNVCWNCGVEGPTAEPEVERLRNRQIKNFLTLTMLATGAPMLLMGDEVRRTQGGNNNAFCQNNEISWFDWSLVEKHADIYHFVQELIALRMNRDLPVERLDMTLNETSAPTAGPMARGQIEFTGLGSRIAHTGGYRPLAGISTPVAHHGQRVLDGARIRNSSIGSNARIVATVYRYLSRPAGRYLRLGERSSPARFGVPR